MNLVLHPSSTDRSLPPHPTKTRRRGSSISNTHQRQSRSQTPQAAVTPTQYRSGEQVGLHILHQFSTNLNNQGYYPPLSEPSFPSASQYSTSPTSETPSWGYTSQSPQVDRNASTFSPPSLPSIHSFGRAQANGTEPWQPEADTDALPYRAWAPDAAYQQPADTFSNSQIDPALRGTNSEGRGTSNWAHPDRYNQEAPPPLSVDVSTYSSTPYQPPPPPYYSSNHTHSTSLLSSSTSRHTYTRTLVGPLATNACRLMDEHRKPGIFFLFQDLSVRTEGILPHIFAMLCRHTDYPV